MVRAGGRRNAVVAGATANGVVARACINHVIAVAAFKNVVSAQARQHIAGVGAADAVVLELAVTVDAEDNHFVERIIEVLHDPTAQIERQADIVDVDNDLLKRAGPPVDGQVGRKLVGPIELAGGQGDNDRVRLGLEDLDLLDGGDVDVGEVIPARIGEQEFVLSAAACDALGAGVVCGKKDEGVVPAAAEHRIDAGTAIDDVASRAAIDDIVVTSGIDRVAAA